MTGSDHRKYGIAHVAAEAKSPKTVILPIQEEMAIFRVHKSIEISTVKE